MGLAVYNSIILDLHFPSVCYKKLLTPPVVPAGEASSVGIVIDPTIDDLAEIMPDVAQSLRVRKPTKTSLQTNGLDRLSFASC